jgi:hypothetical protein
MPAPIIIATRQTFAGVSSASTPVDISGWPNGADFTLSLLVASSAGVTALISIQDSADLFVSDTRLVASLDLQGAVNPPTDIAVSWRARELGSCRVGHASATCRVLVTSASAACSVTLSAGIS